MASVTFQYRSRGPSLLSPCKTLLSLTLSCLPWKDKEHLKMKIVNSSTFLKERSSCKISSKLQASNLSYNTLTNPSITSSLVSNTNQSITEWLILLTQQWVSINRPFKINRPYKQCMIRSRCNKIYLIMNRQTVTKNSRIRMPKSCKLSRATSPLLSVPCHN